MKIDEVCIVGTAVVGDVRMQLDDDDDAAIGGSIAR
jgi:hypothetical protein